MVMPVETSDDRLSSSGNSDTFALLPVAFGEPHYPPVRLWHAPAASTSTHARPLPDVASNQSR